MQIGLLVYLHPWDFQKVRTSNALKIVKIVKLLLVKLLYISRFYND